MSDITANPIWTSKRNTATRILKQNFGDGYSQRAGDGINTTADAWDVEFRGTSTVIDAIVVILETKAGHTYFTWSYMSTQKWVCKQWSYGDLGHGERSLSATFEEVFDL